MTRSQNSFLNMISGTLSSLLVIALSFVTRTVFIRTLGSSYLGIEGYFTNILNMLSLANLGFDTAIVYKLYKPIEENDRHRIQLLMKLYRQVYFVIGWVIAVLGLCLIPFLPRLVRDYDRFASLGLNAVFIFLIYLFKNVSSYWIFAYKNSFIKATQKNYILTVIGYVVSVVDCVVQIVILAVKKNFLFYLFAQIFFVVLRNILNAIVCDHRHPYLKEKIPDRVSSAELKGMFSDCSATMLHRISGTVLGSSDNIVLTAMIGLDAAGLYANYLLVKNNLASLLYTVINAAEASLGSLHSTDHVEWSRLGFRVINFLSIWLFGVGAIGLAVLLDDFIALWAGPGYLVTSFTTAAGVTVSTPLALLVGIEFYQLGQVNYCRIFRNITGTFRQVKFRPVLSVVVNLAVSILLMPYLGIAACVVSTIVAYQTTYLLFDPQVICRSALKMSPRDYFLINNLYRIVTVAAGLLSWWICSVVSIAGIAGFIVHGCICVAVPSAVYALCFFKTTEFRFLLNTAKDLVFSRLHPGGKSIPPETP